MTAGEPSSRSFAFAAGGGRAAWVRDRAGSRGTFELVWLDLRAPAAQPVRIPEPLQIVPELALSADGARAAFLQPGVIRVFELDTGAAAVSRDLPDWRVPRSLYFAPDGGLRLYPRVRLEPGGPSARELLELDTATGELAATGRIAVVTSGAIFRPGASRDAAILLELGRTRASLLDPRTGVRRADLAVEGEVRGAGFLADGRIVTVSRTERGGTAISILDASGVPQSGMHLPSTPAAVAILASPAPGRLVIGTNPVGANSTRTWSIVVLDLPGNRIVRTWRGHAPLDPLEFWTASALPTIPESATVPAIGASGSLVTLDAAGEK